MTRITRQPRASTDPEPTTVDAIFGLCLFFVIVCLALALWFGVVQEIVAQMEPYFRFHILMPR